MFTLHITHEVTDYDAWKTAFDSYDRVRRDNGVLAYRIAREAPDGKRLHIELDFGTRDQARDFTTVLEGGGPGPPRPRTPRIRTRRPPRGPHSRRAAHPPHRQPHLVS
ncbi:hypothetical protein NSK11_contig00134-0001, partial [Nocardia seriolae]